MNRPSPGPLARPAAAGWERVIPRQRDRVRDRPRGSWIPCVVSCWPSVLSMNRPSPPAPLPSDGRGWRELRSSRVRAAPPGGSWSQCVSRDQDSGLPMHLPGGTARGRPARSGSTGGAAAKMAARRSRPRFMTREHGACAHEASHEPRRGAVQSRVAYATQSCPGRCMAREQFFLEQQAFHEPEVPPTFQSAARRQECRRYRFMAREQLFFGTGGFP